MESHSKFLEAFIEQTYAPHGGIDEFEAKRNEVFQMADDMHDNHIKKAKDIMNRPQDFVHHLNVLTQLEPGELDETPEVHEHFKGYDHSLEADRLALLRDRYGYVEPEHTEAQDVGEIQMTTEPYENIDPAEVPNLNGLFDNVFGI